MSALLAFLVTMAASMTTVPHACLDFELESSETTDNIWCHDDDVTYAPEHFRLIHDPDDGDIIGAQVWD